MRIVVCVKQVLDPEIAPRDFRLDPATGRPIQGNARLVMDSYAENALELAIQLRDSIPGATVTALCLGDKPAEETLRRALSFTANAAVRVWDPGAGALDGQAVGHVLACTIRALGGADLILTGRQAGDVEEGLVGPVLAEELGIACSTLVSRVEISGGKVRAVREAEDGLAVMSLPVPAALSVTSSEVNVPRLPKTRDVMMARSKPIRLLGFSEIGVDPGKLVPGVQLERAYVPTGESQCDLVPGSTGDEQGEALARRLHELKVI